MKDTTKVLTLSPNNLKVLYRRALAYEALSDIVKSQQDIDEILRLDPNNQLAQKTNERLQKVLIQKSPPKAKASSSSSVKSSSSKDSSNWQVDTLKNEALKYLSKGSVGRAVEVLTQALELAQSDGDVDQILSIRQLLARAYVSLEDYEKSLEVSEEILRDYPNNFLALSRAGDSAFHLVIPPLLSPYSLSARASWKRPRNMRLGSFELIQSMRMLECC